MGLTKQNLDISFLGGLDLKSDPWRVSSSNFLALSNLTRNTLGRLTKRNGFGSLAALPTNTYSFLTTFNGDLTAIGPKLQAYSTSLSAWKDRGSITPVSLSVLPLVRTASSQVQCDAAVSSTGLVCTTYSDFNGTTTTFNYVVSDAATGQVFLGPTALLADSTYGAPRVFVVGNYFVIMYSSSTANTLKYVAVDYTALTVGAPVTISRDYSPATTVAFDGYVTGSYLYIVWNTVASGIKMAYLSPGLVLSAATNPDPSHQASVFTITADETGNSTTIYVNYCLVTGVTSAAYVFAVNSILTPVFAATATYSDGTGHIVENMASVAKSASCTVYFEISDSYSWNRVSSNYILQNTVSQAGSVGVASILVRSVGLGSKAFLSGGITGTPYFVAAYDSPYQSTYFLIDYQGKVAAKVAYTNGGGYYATGLPSVSLYGGNYYVSYLFQDLITPVSKTTNPVSGTQTSGVYSQTGINLAGFEFSTTSLQTAEIGNNLHLNGGFLWMYDGNAPVEHNFHVWPDSIGVVGNPTVGSLTVQTYNYQVIYVWTDNQGNIHRSAPSIPVSYTIVTPPASFTANRTSGSDTLTGVSSLTGLQVGQKITGTGIPANTSISGIVAGLSTITMSNNATSGSGTATTVTPTVLTTLQIDVPMLRLTYKTNVKIEVYRWSTAQQVYYALGVGNANPVINDPTLQAIGVVDILADASLLGNQILYTTGGVVENTGSPACTGITLFDDRFWLINAENENELWFSKQVIQATPVEMSQQFTYYVAPSIGAQGSTGKSKALAVLDDKLIIAKPNALYYVTGSGPDITGASDQYSQPIFITSTIGSTNPKSFVLIPEGLMFQSSDGGIWLLGRDLDTKYIGAPMEAYNSYTVLSAINVPNTNEVRFMMSNGITLVYDYYTKEWATFNVPGVSATSFQSLHTFINSDGLAFQETPGVYLDGNVPVTWSFATAWFNLAGLQGYQRAYWAFLLGTYRSAHTLSVSVAYDYASSPSQTLTITPTGSAVEQWQINFQYQQCQSVQLTVQENVVVAGAGLELSGIDLVYGAKKAYPRRLSSAVKTG